jgi:hypothetical protein
MEGLLGRWACVQLGLSTKCSETGLDYEQGWLGGEEVACISRGQTAHSAHRAWLDKQGCVSGI